MKKKIKKITKKAAKKDLTGVNLAAIHKRLKKLEDKYTQLHQWCEALTLDIDKYLRKQND